MEVLKPRCQKFCVHRTGQEGIHLVYPAPFKIGTQFLLNQNELLTVLIHARLETAAPPSPTLTGIPYCPCTGHEFNMLGVA